MTEKTDKTEFTSKREAYSYRSDPMIPTFDEEGPRTVMDANCSLCARGARWIVHNDSRDEFKIIPLQSDLGRALMVHYGLDPEDPLSWLFLENGHAYNSLDALIRAGWRLGGIWRGLSALKLLPRSIQDRLYSFVARNRYRFFGRTDLCSLPDAQVQKRLLS